MKITRVFIAQITVPKTRLRKLNPDKVKSLAKSMKAIGLQYPITMRKSATNEMHLIAGLHRLEAAKSLGWDTINCIFMDGSLTKRDLWEIDENLMRAELTPSERRAHLRKRKKIWLKMQEEAKELGGTSRPTQLDARGQKKTPQQEKGFAADTAEITGMSKRQINRLLADPKPKPEPLIGTDQKAGGTASMLLTPAKAKKIARRLQRFQDAIVGVTDNCEICNELVDIPPHLTQTQTDLAVEQLKKAEKNLKSIRGRIERAFSEGKIS